MLPLPGVYYNAYLLAGEFLGKIGFFFRRIKIEKVQRDGLLMRTKIHTFIYLIEVSVISSLRYVCK